jgi:signal transduction histidine kinase
MAGQAQEKEIQVEVEIEPDLPPLDVNARHAKQLWTNLVSNAIKYTPDGGHVDITFKQEGERLTGVVADTGIGIPENELPLIFEDFYRSKAAKAHTQMGTGLGLSIVRRILEAYGGTIDVTSVEDQGTTFTFQLPV